MKANPLIPLREDALGAPSRLDAAILETVMLWPDDSDKQAAAFETCMITQITQAVTEEPDASVPAWLFQIAAEARPMIQVQNACKEQFVHGSIAGEILYSVVAHAAVGQQLSIRTAIERASKPFCYRRVADLTHVLRLTRRTIENVIWPRYRPVAHLWAAWLGRRSSQRDHNFPCTAGDLPAFLAEAEAYRRVGENTRTFKAPNPVLRAPEMARLPKQIEAALQPDDLVFEWPQHAA